MTSTQTLDQKPSQLMLDHPGWFHSPNGQAHRAFHFNGTVWMITLGQNDSSSETVEIVRHGESSVPMFPIVDTFDPATLPEPFGPALLASGYDKVHRLRNPDVWDAMLPPVFSHRRRLADAARTYRVFCASYGTKVTTESGAALLAPRPEKVLMLDDGAFAKAGIRHRAQAIRVIAHEYLQRCAYLPPNPPIALFKALLEIPNIGSWSAARIVADTTGDFSLYANAGFGYDDRWERFSVELGTPARAHEYREAWKSCTSQQKSILVALTTHRNQSIPAKAEAARIYR